MHSESRRPDRTAHGGEESPIGRSNELKTLLSKGMYGEVCIIPEPEKNTLPIFCKGMCNFHISINRPGQSIHEIEGGKDTPNPNLIAHQLMDFMIKKIGRIVKKSSFLDRDFIIRLIVPIL